MVINEGKSHRSVSQLQAHNVRNVSLSVSDKIDADQCLAKVRTQLLVRYSDYNSTERCGDINGTCGSLISLVLWERLERILYLHVQHFGRTRVGGRKHVE